MFLLNSCILHAKCCLRVEFHWLRADRKEGLVLRTTGDSERPAVSSLHFTMEGYVLSSQSSLCLGISVFDRLDFNLDVPCDCCQYAARYLLMSNTIPLCTGVDIFVQKSLQDMASARALHRRAYGQRWKCALSEANDVPSQQILAR